MNSILLLYAMESRWAQAISPGSIICMPMAIVWVVPRGRPGLLNISERRAVKLSGITLAASSRRADT